MIGIPSKENLALIKDNKILLLTLFSLGWNVYLTLYSFEQAEKRNAEKQKIISDMQDALKVYREATIRGAEIEKASRMLNPQVNTP